MKKNWNIPLKMKKRLEVNRLIVEGKNDIGFIKSNQLVLGLNKTNFQLSKLQNGLSESDIIEELKTIKNDLENESKTNIKIGFILDKDFVTEGYIERYIYLNNAIERVFEINPNLSNKDFTKSIKYEDLTIEFSYFLMQNSKSEGELIDVLKEIKKIPGTIADCVTNCFQQKIDYTDKEISDDWLHIYLKWDSCEYGLRRNSENFSMDKSITISRLDSIFDLKSEKLTNLQNYLLQIGA